MKKEELMKQYEELKGKVDAIAEALMNGGDLTGLL